MQEAVLTMRPRIVHLPIAQETPTGIRSACRWPLRFAPRGLWEEEMSQEEKNPIVIVPKSELVEALVEFERKLTEKAKTHGGQIEFDFEKEKGNERNFQTTT